MQEITLEKDSAPMVVYADGERRLLQPGETLKAGEILIPISENGENHCSFFAGPPEG